MSRCPGSRVLGPLPPVFARQAGLFAGQKTQPQRLAVPAGAHPGGPHPGPLKSDSTGRIAHRAGPPLQGPPPVGLKSLSFCPQWAWQHQATFLPVALVRAAPAADPGPILSSLCFHALSIWTLRILPHPVQPCLLYLVLISSPWSSSFIFSSSPPSARDRSTSLETKTGTHRCPDTDTGNHAQTGYPHKKAGWGRHCSSGVALATSHHLTQWHLNAHL